MTTPTDTRPAHASEFFDPAVKPPPFDDVAKVLKEVAEHHHSASDSWLGSKNTKLGEKHARYGWACREAPLHYAAVVARMFRLEVENAELHATIAKLTSSENQNAKSL